jgi:hypothetical protein
MTTTYVFVMPVRFIENLEKELIEFLHGKNSMMSFGGSYDEYAFYTADLTDEEAIYAALRFGPEVQMLESKNESTNDLIVRIFNAGHKTRLSS